MTDQQPEALRLADALEDDLVGYDRLSLPRRCQDIADEAAADLRRLYAENQELLEALKKISAIENKDYGSDWEEIEQARNIADAAITKAEGANND